MKDRSIEVALNTFPPLDSYDSTIRRETMYKSRFLEDNHVQNHNIAYMLDSFLGENDKKEEVKDLIYILSRNYSSFKEAIFTIEVSSNPRVEVGIYVQEVR